LRPFTHYLFDVIHVGGVWATYIILSGFLVYLISKYENNLKYADYFLISSFLMRALGWGSYIFATSLWHLYAIQIFLALGEAFGTPSYNSLFSKYLDKGKFASEWGLQTTINSSLMGGAAFIGSLIVKSFGFNSLFIAMIILSLISTLFAIRFKKSFGVR